MPFNTSYLTARISKTRVLVTIEGRNYRHLEFEGSLRRGDQLRPDPLVMLDHARRREMRAIADHMAIADDDDGVAARHRGADGGIDAEIGRPARDEQPTDASRVSVASRDVL